MSRIGKKPVPVPAGVTATIDGQKVVAKGPKGELSFVANDEVSLKLEDNALLSRPWITPRTPAPSGACRAP
jgi:large subunit ribosomal protein L6